MRSISMTKKNNLNYFILCISVFLLVSCGGVSKKDITDVCSSISSRYIDSQLKQGIWEEDPRFRNLLLELRKKNGITPNDPGMLSRTIYSNIALSALLENRKSPNFYNQCIKDLSEDFEVK